MTLFYDATTTLYKIKKKIRFAGPIKNVKFAYYRKFFFSRYFFYDIKKTERFLKNVHFILTKCAFRERCHHQCDIKIDDDNIRCRNTHSLG